MASMYGRPKRKPHGNAGIAVCVVSIVVALLIYAYFIGVRDERARENPAGAPAQAQMQVWPQFDCEEDEIMEWVDARKTARCVNVEEFIERETGHNHG